MHDDGRRVGLVAVELSSAIDDDTAAQSGLFGTPTVAGSASPPRWTESAERGVMSRLKGYSFAGKASSIAAEM